mgnify:FL=1
MNTVVKNRKKIFFTVGMLFVLCSIVEYIEFLFIRTDQTIIADNVFTKIFCIIATLVVMKINGIKIQDLGFKNNKVIKYLGCGLGLGILTFAISYGVEYIILTAAEKNPNLEVYITNFGLTGATSEVSLSAMAVIICIVVNIINVIAEEGLFRGFILKVVSEKSDFKVANMIQAILFGVWHIVMCVLGVYDGQMTIPVAIVFGVGYVILAGILGIEWGICVNMTGVIWMCVAEHFFNNFIGNILHVVSSTGTDELQIIRIVLSNVLSLIIVMGIDSRNKKVSNGYTSNAT